MMERTLLKQFWVVCVAVVFCATVSAEGATNCSNLGTADCCDPVKGSGCGLCSSASSADPVCQTLNNDTCTAESSKCSSAEKCTAQDNTTCCADQICGWCPFNDTVLRCQLLTAETCNETVSQCKAAVVDCTTLKNASECCDHQNDCAWCEGPTKGQSVCQKLSESTCNTTADTCADVQCQSLESDQCCNNTAHPDCGWCMLDDMKTLACRSLKSESCNKTGNQCGDVFCQSLDNATTCCGADASKKCGWCMKGDTPACRSLDVAECNSTLDQCGDVFCQSLDNETACCGADASKNCGWCMKGDTPACRSLNAAECNSTLDQCGAFFCASLTQDQCCNDTIGRDCGYCSTPENTTTCQIFGPNCNATLDTCKAKKCGELNETECCSDQFASLKCGYCLKEAKLACQDLKEGTCSGAQNMCEKTVDFCPNLTTDKECCANSTCGWCGTNSSSCFSKSDTHCQSGENACDAKTTTTAGPVTSSPAPSTGGQHFDAASFIGGIVLATGIAGIALFAYKYYASKKANNYHTL